LSISPLPGPHAPGAADRLSSISSFIAVQLPLPQGEGWGEGVKYSLPTNLLKGFYLIPSSRPFSSLSHWEGGTFCLCAFHRLGCVISLHQSMQKRLRSDFVGVRSSPQPTGYGLRGVHFAGAFALQQVPSGAGRRPYSDWVASSRPRASASCRRRCSSSLTRRYSLCLRLRKASVTRAFSSTPLGVRR